MNKQAIYFLSALFLASACTEPATTDPDGGTDPAKPQTKYVTGQVTDSQGRPLKGAYLFVENTLYVSSGADTKSDDKGNYKIKLTLGSYLAKGQYEVDYNNRHYVFDLQPDNDQSFTDDEGAVRNFTWKLSGKKNARYNLYHGGTIELLHDPNSQLWDIENVEFTLKPVGPLIDGSTGRTLTMKSADPGLPNYLFLVDIPIGRYTISAVHKPTGRKVLLQNVNSNQPYAESLTQDFYGFDSPRHCKNCMGLGYKFQGE
ncbi:carboxypeptidase-like regulatory domain-containing protein [Tellurirhabdus rosea]|uniref:carboxypeptidase-like regulatory domain-containing protein n=1 Tax=Tellurirhabdus rosea TaxID=2674997 RepID=UPI0022562228|nr:carboxypeptidase-like regulatory domain-containing protein [Tellurirhabdus rosea]